MVKPEEQMSEVHGDSAARRVANMNRRRAARALVDPSFPTIW
jgi:hypothetical protein